MLWLTFNLYSHGRRAFCILSCSLQSRTSHQCLYTLPLPTSSRWTCSKHTRNSAHPTPVPAHGETASYILGGNRTRGSEIHSCFVLDLCLCIFIRPLTVAAEVTVSAVDPLDVSDDLFILTVFTLACDVVDPLKLLRTGQAAHKIHFPLRTNTQRGLQLQINGRDTRFSLCLQA